MYPSKRCVQVYPKVFFINTFSIRENGSSRFPSSHGSEINCSSTKPRNRCSYVLTSWGTLDARAEPEQKDCCNPRVPYPLPKQPKGKKKRTLGYLSRAPEERIRKSPHHSPGFPATSLHGEVSPHTSALDSVGSKTSGTRIMSTGWKDPADFPAGRKVRHRAGSPRRRKIDTLSRKPSPFLSSVTGIPYMLYVPPVME